MALQSWCAPAQHGHTQQHTTQAVRAAVGGRSSQTGRAEGVAHAAPDADSANNSKDIRYHATADDVVDDDLS